jgi:hypothetical protein
MTLNEQLKNHGYNGSYEMVMNLAQAMLAGHGLQYFFVNSGPKKAKTRHARPRIRPSILRSKFMIAQYLNFQSTLLTSKVDKEMPLRGSASIREEIFS